METKEFVSSYEHYYTCRSRDMCLRFMGENPSRFADISVCPCPCSKDFYESMILWNKCVHDREILGELPYSVWREMRYRQESKGILKPPTRKRRMREIPLTQKRLFE